jgi:hypothetical protein
MLEELFNPNPPAESFALLIILLRPKITELCSLRLLRSDIEARIFATGGVITDPSSQRRQYDENNSHVQALRQTDQKISVIRTFIAKSFKLSSASEVDKLSKDQLLAMVDQLKNRESSNAVPNQQPK